MDTKIRIINDRAFGEEDEMSQTDIHNDLIMYLILVLRQLFLGQNTAIFTSIDLYGDPAHPGQKKSPDILVIDGVTQNPDHPIISYTIDEEHAPPRVLMEINSTSNWITDLEEKHDVYERMRVPEYFVCDPQPERVWTGVWRNEPRLLGWRYNSLIGGYVRIPQEPRGLWSEQLNCYLRMDGVNGRELHLYDIRGNRRLTEAEAERQRAELEQQRAEVERQRAEAERQRAQAAIRQFEQERLAAEVERQRSQKLLERLKQLDPDFKLDEDETE